MRYAPHSLRRRSGFTLIEMLIVAALIVIFSTIAIFSMQELMESARRKAAIADLRTVAHTLAASYMDLGFFPKVGYLGYALHGADPVLGVARGDADDPELPPGFDAMGHLAIDNTPFARRVRTKWTGRYLPDSSPRSVLSYSPYAYTSKMRVPNSGGDDEIMAWPCDPWGNPYVVYLVHKPEDPDSDEWWIQKATEKANYLAIVVSYGRNQIPGGPGDFHDLSDWDQIRAAAENYKLYRRDDTGAADFVVLERPDPNYDEAPERYNNNRLDALYHDWGYMSGVTTNYVPGILDEEIDEDHPASDDIVVPIP